MRHIPLQTAVCPEINIQKINDHNFALVKPSKSKQFTREATIEGFITIRVYIVF